MAVTLGVKCSVGPGQSVAVTGAPAALGTWQAPAHYTAPPLCQLNLSRRRVPHVTTYTSPLTTYASPPISQLKFSRHRVTSPMSSHSHSNHPPF